MPDQFVPDGNQWWIATPVENLSPEDLGKYKM